MRSAADVTNVSSPKLIKVSIIIKSLNEEANIARAIESAIAAATPHAGEVIVADSGSTDRTVDIAMRYPTRVVQLENFKEGCCGVGPQLGFQHSSGEYIYILDGDMELDANFLQRALELLECQPSLAAVGGLTREMRVKNIEFKNRARHFLNRQVENGSEVECLVGGGLYRRAAIEEVRYLSDRNLHGFEEYDVGARLRSKGWRIVRINTYAVNHYSYQIGSYRLLWRRLRAGRLLALGEILRAAARGKYLVRAVAEVRPIRFALGTLLFWAVAALFVSLAPNINFVITFLGLSAILPVAVMTARSRSLTAGVYSVAVWQLTGITLLLGLTRTRKPPAAVIACRLLHASGTTVPERGTASSASGLKLQAVSATVCRAEAELGGISSRPASADPSGYYGSA
jgi:glycosyltransferase involved in cell wall biosynthesis